MPAARIRFPGAAGFIRRLHRANRTFLAASGLYLDLLAAEVYSAASDAEEALAAVTESAMPHRRRAAAASAAKVSTLAAKAVLVEEPLHARLLAEEAAREAAEAAEAAEWEIGPGLACSMTHAIQQDAERLARHAAAERWSDTTAVHPSVLGTLWPGGTPPWVEAFRERRLWVPPSLPSAPKDQADRRAEDAQIVITLEVPEGTDPGELIVGSIGPLISELDDLNRALGGFGLRVESVETAQRSCVQEGRR